MPEVLLCEPGHLGWRQSSTRVTALILEERKQQPGRDIALLIAELKDCSRRKDMQRGKEIHAEALESGRHSDLYIANALISMYSQCGSTAEARQVFDRIDRPSVVSWTALIMGYAKNGDGDTALVLFKRMRSEGYAPNCVTFIGALKACVCLAQSGRSGCGDLGRQIHWLASRSGCLSDIRVQSILIHMYAKIGSMEEARGVFDSVKHPDVALWNTLLFGYADNGEGAPVLDLLAQMTYRGCTPNSVTFIAALKACGLLGALEYGKRIHAQMDTAAPLDVIAVTSLIDFYAKCGDMVEAQKVFDLRSTTRNLATWTALLGGYTRLAEIEAAFETFDGLQEAGYQPDAVTYTCILTCCSHAGLAEMVGEYLEAMSNKHGITPSVEHYTCMVDVLGRLGKLDAAMACLQSMPCKPDGLAWRTLLCACRKWRNVEIGRVAFESLLKLDDTDATAYTLMGQIYRGKGMWEEEELVLGMRKKLVAWKDPGRSWWTNELGEVNMFLAVNFGL